MITAQKLLIKTSDTYDELIENEKELVDLLREERDLRKEIRNWRVEMLDTIMEYASGTAYSDSDQYEKIVAAKMEQYKRDEIEALRAIEEERERAYQQYITETNMDGSRKWTDEQAMHWANESEEVRKATEDYIEAIRNQNNLLYDETMDKLDEIQRNIDRLEDSKPKEWSSIEQIRQYTAETIGQLEKKIPELEAALANSANLTDE